MHYFLKTLCGAALLLALFSPLQAQNSNFQLRSSITFPNQTLANICGWTSPDGHEYALVGAQAGLVIVDITNPDVPVQIVQIPGPNNLWKEIKTYSHYAYVTSEGGGGVQIVDLSGLPSDNLAYHNYTGSAGIPQSMTNIHALHIDVTKGFLYTYGGNLESAAVHDLNTDPYNPTYVGRFNDLGYIHDGYADNDTLYACHIYTGLLSIVDMTNKSAPAVLGTIQTPGKFTHNAWLLADHKHILTTDEDTPSFVTSYDISDPSDIIELDRFSIDNGEGSIGHNVQVINDWTVTSWYTGGVVITDCHRPDNLVKTAHYDTWPTAGGPDFDGCWGAFPYFPSGTVIASNIEPGQLFILTPTYKRAAYLEGIVRDGCNGQPLAGATVEILNGDAGSTDVSKSNGVVKTGQVTEGTFTIRVSKAGYTTQTFEANLVSAEVATFEVTLQTGAAYSVTGTVVNQLNQPVGGIDVILSNGSGNITLTTAPDGTFNKDCVIAGTYTVAVWGNNTPLQITLNDATTLNLTLEGRYVDNFDTEYGWTVGGTSPTGVWTRGEPVGTQYQNQESNPDNDVTNDTGAECYVTGNGGGQAGNDDVDDGDAILTCPPMKLAGYIDATLSFSYWFFNAGGSGTPNDQFEVRASNGSSEVILFTTNVSASGWVEVPPIHLTDYITLTDNVRISFIATDDAPGHLLEAGVDKFLVQAITVGNKEIATAAKVEVSPNPTTTDFYLQYNWPGVNDVMLEVRNTLGQIVVNRPLSGEKGNGRFGENLTPGIYTVTISNGTQQSAAVKVVKN